jgi:hypothetical protein
MNSTSYKVSAFNFVARGWYKNMELKKVNQTLNEVHHLIKSRATQIDFKRTYIAKADGGLRPLGVPTLA